MYQDLQANFNDNQKRFSDKKRSTAFFLCLFFGFYGAHRFYTGHVISGSIWALTRGLFGIGWFVDLLFILFGVFSDDKGRDLRKNDIYGIYFLLIIKCFLTSYKIIAKKNNPIPIVK